MRPTLLYDADCGFCTKAARLVPRLHLDVDVVALQTIDLASLNVSSERAVEEMPFVHPDGTVNYGHEAVAAALRTGPAPVHVLGLILGLPALTPIARPAYRWLARHRHRLPGGTAACAFTTNDSDAAT